MNGQKGPAAERATDEVPRTGGGVNRFNQLVLESPCRLGMPIAVYPALALTGACVRDVVTDGRAQFEAAAALHARYRTPFALSAMDLSVEAEAFGCEVCFADNEIPYVVGRRVTLLKQAESLNVPAVGEGRTAVYLDTVRRLKQLTDAPLVLGGCIGPFSLAARLVGMTEAMELTMTQPELVLEAVEKCTTFLSAYARAFRQAGADGLLMAEPAAGLLSPRSMLTFSSLHIKRIAAAAGGGDFSILLHNCAARLPHLPSVLQTGLQTFHFGAPMELAAALGKVPASVVLCGNLDPAGVFLQGTRGELKDRARALLCAARGFKNFVLSSGCDVPASTPLEKLDAFYEALQTA